MPHVLTPAAVQLTQSPVQPLELEPAPGMRLTDLFACEALAAEAFTAGPPSEFSATPPSGGVCFRQVVLPPDPIGHMHNTSSVDLVTVVHGPVCLALADGTETELNEGDTAVIRGVEHAWRNHGAESAVISVVLLGV